MIFLLTKCNHFGISVLTITSFQSASVLSISSQTLLMPSWPSVPRVRLIGTSLPCAKPSPRTRPMMTSTPRFGSPGRYALLANGGIYVTFWIDKASHKTYPGTLNISPIRGSYSAIRGL